MTEDNTNILFVDDEENILAVAKEFFEQKGYSVLTARNGLEAVEILENEEISCCFTDINMPEMDGLQLAERIRVYDNTIPVIVMTGYPSLETTIQTLRNGVVDFLVKPVSLNQMELCLIRVLRERRLFSENILLNKEVESKARIETLNHELQYKVEGLKILNKILSDLSTVSNNQDIFNQVANTAMEISGAEESQFSLLIDSEKKSLKVACITNTAKKTGSNGGPQSSVSHSPQAFGDKMENLILEIAADQIPLLISENNSNRLSKDIRSCMIVPVTIREKTFGVLTAVIKNGHKRFSEKDLYYLSFLTQNAAHAIENLALYENIYSNFFSTLYAFVKAIEVRDPYTQQHSSRVTNISKLLGQELSCTPEELDILNFAGPLHDIGKIGIPDDILLKPGKLTVEEYEKIKEHPDLGADIVGKLGMWDREQEIIRCHHERFDGSGYPDGLKNDEIPLLARILSVADAFDAMASDRAYRRKMDLTKIVMIIKEAAGSQFDPVIVDAFFRLYDHGAINPESV
jgi:putative nucleotidyltransferase with HDIG domain